VKPIVLAANQPRGRFYAGGTAISTFRGDPPAPPNTPEDWVASVTTVRGERETGLTRLPDGSLLADRVREEPARWLGDEHVRAFGPDTNLLVKLLDAGQRLPVHAHPDDGFAAKHLGTAHGKAEAWYILAPGVIHLGLIEDVAEDELARLVREQEIEPLLHRMHSVPVAAGDTVFVPPGVLHAIGEGIFLVEVQQPEDLSILLEWNGFELNGARDGHLGLGFATALAAVERTARTPDDVEALVRREPGAGPALAERSRPFFRIDKIDVVGETGLPAGFGVVVVLAGALTLRGPAGDVRASAGATVLVPATSGRISLVGDASVLHCRPPAPEAWP